MPEAIRQPVLAHVSPNLDDFLFWEHHDLSREDEAALKNNTRFAYGTAHYYTSRYPNHEVVFVKHDPVDGQRNSRRYRIYYAAERAAQDAYNFEYTQADLGGTKYDAVMRTYLIKRSDFDPTTPAVASAMPDVPASQFAASEYVLVENRQARTGDRELDSLYVVVRRLYVKRTSLYESSYDEATDGVLVRERYLLATGETISGYNIETVINVPTFWGVDAYGQMTEARQLTANWFEITVTDVIPQNKDDTGNIFGGIVLRSFYDFVTYNWPPVLGDDGSLTADGSTPVSNTYTEIEVMSWVDKDGNPRNYPRPMFEEHGYRGPCRAKITEEWLLTAPEMDSDYQRPDTMQPKPIVYNSPYLALSIPPTLHEAMTVVCDTSSSDPTWGENTGSARTFPATNYTEWPGSIVATVKVRPFRGGYLVQHVLVYRPQEGPFPPPPP